MAPPLDVLYIHPGRCVSDYNIPAGLIGLMNSLTCTKRGIMYFEMTRDLIARSNIIVMDCHWYFSLAEVGRLARKIKRINRHAKIIVGGHTASIFANALVKRSNVDYVIKGDAEKSFPLLIRALLNGREGKDVPNLVHPRFETPQSYCTTADDFSDCDYISLDWFPLLKRRMTAVHRSVPFACQESLGMYPLIPVYKGCRYDCEFCYAKQSSHRRLYKRGYVLRKPENVVRDLVRCSRHPSIDTVYFVADFIHMAGASFTRKIFSRKYDLNLYYEFEHFNAPPVAVFRSILRCFKKCKFCFVLGEPFTPDPMKRYRYLAGVLAFLKRARPGTEAVIFYGGSPNSLRLCRALQRQYPGLELFPYQQWFIRAPALLEADAAKPLKYFEFWRRKADKEAAGHFFAVSLQHDVSRFQLLMMESLLKKKKYRRALGCRKKVLEYAPYRDMAFFYTAKAYWGLRCYDQAIKNASKVHRKNAKVHFLLGLCYEKKKLYQKAIQEYETAEKMSPQEIMISAALRHCRKRAQRY